jgi:hypothetical protein
MLQANVSRARPRWGRIRRAEKQREMIGAGGTVASGASGTDIVLDQFLMNTAAGGMASVRMPRARSQRRRLSVTGVSA